MAGFASPTGTAPTAPAFVGCRHSPREQWSLLPTYPPDGQLPAPLPKGRFGRFFSLANDKWMIGPLVFKIATPFPAGIASTHEDAFRYAPVVCAYLEYDNIHSEQPADLVFGIVAPGSALSSAASDLCGFAVNNAYGFAAPQSGEVSERAGAAVFDSGSLSACALRFHVPPHSRRIFPLVFGFFDPGFHYANHHRSLIAALRFGLAHHARYLAEADAHDSKFMRSTLPSDAKQALALRVRTWLSETRRLLAEPEIDVAPLVELCRPLSSA